MIEMARGLSFVAYRYEGGPLRFTVTFPFLQHEHVRVLVGDPKSPRTVVAQWIDSNTLEIQDQAPALVAPYEVVLRRITPITAPQVNFQDAAMLPARQLNVAVRQLLYAQQELVEFGLDGNGLPGTGIPGGGGGNIPDIQTIVDQVVQSPAYQILQQRIPEIDANAELVMEEILRSNRNFDFQRDYGDQMSTAVRRITLTETAQRTVAEDLTKLLARIQTLDSDVAAQFTQVFEAVAEEERARVRALTDLHAQIKTETSTTVAQAVSEVTVEVDRLGARVDSQDGTIASFEDSLAATNESLRTAASAAGANTAWRQEFASQWGGVGATGTSVASAVRSQIDTKATPDEARTISSQTVSAFANGEHAALQQSFNAYVNANNGRWESTWSVRINGGDVNNPVIGGIALSGTPNGFDFVVSTDRFAIVPPGGHYNNRTPVFVTGVVGGLNTVGITGQLLVDGSITADKLRVNSLAAVTANAGTLNGGTFRTHTLDANGNIIDPHEFRGEMSNVGAFPLWIGSGEKNANNAIFWVDRSGNSGFAGRVSAPNITGNFQRTITVQHVPQGNDAFATQAGTELVRFDLPAPILAGEFHTPVMCMALNVQSLGGHGVIRVRLERLQGGAWVYLTDMYVEQGNGWGLNHSFNTIAPATAAHETYRLVAVGVRSWTDLRVNNIAGYMFGLR